MMNSTWTVALAAALLLQGCAAAVPGYSPPTAKSAKYRENLPKGGGFDDAGHYALTEQEAGLNCKQLTGAVTLKIIQIRQAIGRAPPSAIAAMAQETARPLLGGSSYGSNLARDLKRDRARLVALNGALASKGCGTFDLDAELKPGNTERPKPIRNSAKKG
ncbi:MAG: hypothetical protein R3D67_01195 [Hyphomicrobiaceae bacterium]